MQSGGCGRVTDGIGVIMKSNLGLKQLHRLTVGVGFLWLLLMLTGGTVMGALVTSSDLVHSRIYRDYAEAVVGITCKGKMPWGTNEGSFVGTGAVVSPDGLVLTTITTVPRDAKDIRVYFIDGRVLPGTIKRMDESTEGVLIQVKGRRLTCMRPGASQACKVGDPVYSWGNPYQTIIKDGMASLSSGVISGIYDISSVDDESRYIGPVLETDAAINPGSDGGPLTDPYGRLLGMQSLAFSGNRWLGTAIPIHHIAKSMPELKIPAHNAPLKDDVARAWACEIALAQLAEAVSPATVGILVVRQNDNFEIPENRRTFKLKPMPAYTNDEQRAAAELRRIKGGFCSGFIVAPEGLVLTAAGNVAEGSSRGSRIKQIYVYLENGLRMPARVLGRDSFYDIAVLQLDGSSGGRFAYVDLGQTKGLQPGSAVALLGRSEPPGNLTLNVGLVSACGRFQNTCTQISALMNYGNLGGPVLDLSGKVVGMATRLTEKTPWRQNCGVGFMLNAEIIRKILPELKEGKTVPRPKRPFLGVQTGLGGAEVKGAYVARVLPNSAAAEAGVKEGDVIIEFQGKKIEDNLELIKAIQQCQIGDRVKFKVKRDGQILTLEAVLGEMDY